MGNSEQLGYQLRTVTRVSQVSVQAAAMWAADQGCLDIADPWLEPSPVSDTSCLQQPPKGRHHGASTAASSAAQHGTWATGVPGPALV